MHITQYFLKHYFYYTSITIDYTHNCKKNKSIYYCYTHINMHEKYCKPSIVLHNWIVYSVFFFVVFAFVTFVLFNKRDQGIAE